MKIQKLSEASIKPENGGKINGLIRLKKLKLPVPEGIIINQAQKINYASPETLHSLKISIAQKLSDGTTYIVRSSGQMEDGAEASFAGLYTSVRNCQTLEEVWRGIETCVASADKSQLKSYQQELGLPGKTRQLSVLIQEQVAADISGIAFSMNPLTNHDQEMLIETVEGAGDVLADGLVEPERAVLSWHSPHVKPLFEVLRTSITQAVRYFGYPLDIEFCFSGGQLFIVQARPITRLAPKIRMGSWTTANFRDGGVAAQACPALMWSLYREAWQASLEDFILENSLLPDQEVYRLAVMKYARPYWNVGLVKTAMSRIPGYTEREFDDELGITKHYQGDGFQSQVTPKTLFQLARVALKISATTRHHQKQAEHLKHDLLERFVAYEVRLDRLNSSSSSLEEIENLWREIVCEGHLAAEGTYFKQVFINTVQLSMKKTAILKHISLEAFFQLISNLGEVSHIRPGCALKRISDLLAGSAELKSYWQNTTTDQLAVEIAEAITKEPSKRADLKALTEWFKTYGYHSERELNLLWPSFNEEPALIIEKLKELLNGKDLKLGLQAPLQSDEMDRILDAEAINPRRAASIKQSIISLRELLWWREEFKDISTRYYYLIRQISLVLGQHYSTKGILKQSGDIFYLEKENILHWMKGKLSASHLQTQADQNRLYCEAYRNYHPAGDLQAGHDLKVAEHSSNELTGIGANDGIVTGRVRILTDVSQIRELQSDEILVTPFTDTGWSHRFGSLKGLITETGGVLSHATIVAREFGLPAIIGAKYATKHLRTGMMIQMNGASGEIHILDPSITDKENR